MNEAASTHFSPRRVLVPLGLATCLSLFGDLTLFAALAPQVESVGLLVAQLSVLLSVHRFIRLPANPLAGYLADRFGRRPLFVTGLALAVASTAAYGLVSGFWPFLLARLAWGLAWALINVCGLNMALDISTSQTRGRFTGFLNLAVFSGYALGPLLGGFLVDFISFRQSMLVLAGFSAVGLALALLALPETRSPLRPDRSNGAPSLSLKQMVAAGWKKSSAGLRRMAGLWRGGAISTGMTLFAITRFAEDGVMLTTVVLLLQQRFGASITLGGFTLGLASASGIVTAVRSAISGGVAPAAGWFSDKTKSRLPVVAGGLVVGLAAFLIFAFTSNNLVLAVSMLAGALCSGVTLAPLPAYLRDHTPADQQGVVMGAFATAGDLGSMIGPLLVFSLVDVIGLQGIYLACAGLYVLALGLIGLRREK